MELITDQSIAFDFTSFRRKDMKNTIKGTVKFIKTNWNQKKKQKLRADGLTPYLIQPSIGLTEPHCIT